MTTYGEGLQNSECVSPGFEYDALIIKPALLLHSCCGPCSAPVIEELAYEFAVTVYFYNPNITDRDEYIKRLESQKKFIDEFNNRISRPDNVCFIEGEYDPESFLCAAIGFEEEPEGGERCRKCFRLRLEKTAETAILRGFDCFATTLSASPYKNYSAISEIGKDICARYGIGFIDRDFKKNGGYQRSLELSKKYSLYRQGYCGCEFSKGEK